MKKNRSIVFIILALFMIMPNVANAKTRNDDLKEKSFIEELQIEKNFDLQKTVISYDSVPKPIIIEEGKENYINPITKEYFILEDVITRSGTIAKQFSFEIRVAVTSSPFRVDSTRLSVSSVGTMYDNFGNYAQPDMGGNTYGVSLEQGWFQSYDTLFPINGSQTSTFGSGWNTSKDTTVRIYNDGSFDKYTRILKGSGRVYND